jgi:hypothetical protein
MSSDDLAIYLFLWGSAFAFGLGAITMVDSGRKKLLGALWVAAAAFIVAALGWPWIAEKWPEAKAAAQSISGNQLAIDALGLTVFGLLVLDFVMRRKWLALGPQTAKQRGPDNESLNNALQGLFERVGQIEQLPSAATDEDHRNLAAMVANLAKTTNARVDELSSNSQKNRDILLLMHFVIYQSTVLMLDDILAVAPPGITIHQPISLGGDWAIQNAAANEFIDLTRRRLDSGTWRRQNFEGVMTTASSEAEYSLEQTPVSERPSGIDPLALRRWAIAHRQCARAIQFIENEKQEAEQNLRNQRHNLLERYTEMNK